MPSPTPAVAPTPPAEPALAAGRPAVGRPTTLLAELTHRCPLHCPYCSNPLELLRKEGELSTDEWRRVLSEARALGVLQLGLSGGEPLVRRDLEALVAHARSLGLYTTLVTSGLGLTPERMAALRDAGLDHVQVSLQGADEESTARIAGVRAWPQKMAALAVARGSGLAFTINVVLHRENIGQVAALVELAGSLGADRLELANTQYYGWAARNREALMPTREQVAAADPVVAAAIETWRGRMQILYVLPDWHQTRPKPCMGGWGSVYLVVAPDGRVLPCQAATSITTLAFPSAREHSMEWIWRESPAFQAYRGDAWMQAPCRDCAFKARDFGGCRCQAFLLTGSAESADPVCSLSPHRALIDAAMADNESLQARPALVYRTLNAER